MSSTTLVATTRGNRPGLSLSVAGRERLNQLKRDDALAIVAEILHLDQQVLFSPLRRKHLLAAQAECLRLKFLASELGKLLDLDLDLDLDQDQDREL